MKQAFCMLLLAEMTVACTSTNTTAAPRPCFCAEGYTCLVDNCVNCSDNECNISDTNSVCATNGHTYPNLCELEKEKCLENENFELESYGACLTLPPPPAGGACLDHRRLVDISSAEFRLKCDRTVICPKLENGSLTTQEILACYRPNCLPNDMEYIYAPLQCLVLCGWCWCSSADGIMVNGTLRNQFTSTYRSCDSSSKSCNYRERSVENGGIVPMNCGFCKCIEGMMKCYENFASDAEGNRNSSQWIMFKTEVSLLFYIQYVNQEHLRIDVSILDELPIRNVPSDKKERVLQWKFQYYDIDDDLILLPPEEENFNNEVYNFIRCSSFVFQIHHLLDINSDNIITLLEWNNFFNY